MSRWLPVAALLIAVGALTARSVELQPWTLDDAYISFRYAENWAQGHGPVYNVGERVEGYTCFLWVTMLALGSAVGLELDGLAKALGGLFAVLTLAALAGAYRWIDIDARASGIAAVSLGCCGAFSGWALSGMEVSLVAMLVLGAWLLHWRARPVAAGLVAGLAALARPDAMLVGGVAVAELAARRQWRSAGLQLAALGGVFVPYWLARWAWYGWPLPNTFYAKVGATPEQLDRGLEYVLAGSLPLAPVWLPLLLLPWLPGWRRYAGALVWIALHLTYVVAVGGDAMPAWRFLVPVLAPIALIGGAAISRWAPAVVPLAALSIVAAHVHPELSTRILGGNVGRNGREVGLWLSEQVAPGTWIATNTAGSVPYFSGLPTIDMLGLCDEHIAHTEVRSVGRAAGHERGDGAYVLGRAPAFVLFGAARGSRRPVFQTDRELASMPAFRDRYVLEGYALPSGNTLWLWRRRDALRPEQAPLPDPPGPP